MAPNVQVLVTRSLRSADTETAGIKEKQKQKTTKKKPAVTPAHDVTDCVWPRRHGDGTNKHEAAGSPSEPDLRPSPGIG